MGATGRAAVHTLPTVYTQRRDKMDIRLNERLLSSFTSISGLTVAKSQLRFFLTN